MAPHIPSTPQYQRQRPALLELDGNTVYAGFGSLGDFNAERHREVGFWDGRRARALLTPLTWERADRHASNFAHQFFLVVNLDVGLRHCCLGNSSVLLDRKLRLQLVREPRTVSRNYDL